MKGALLLAAIPLLSTALVGLSPAPLRAQRTPPPQGALGETNPDLSGLWKKDHYVIELYRTDKGFKGVMREVDSVGLKWGYNPGDVILDGTFDGKTLRGWVKLHHYAPSYRGRCPQQWETLSDFELTLSSDGENLDGTWKDGWTVNEDCTQNTSSQYTVYLTRVLRHPAEKRRAADFDALFGKPKPQPKPGRATKP